MLNNFIRKSVATIASVIIITGVSANLNGAGINTGNYKVCIDSGHQAKGNMTQEEIAPGSSKKKPKVAYGTRGVATKKYEYQLTLEIGLKLRDALKSKGYQTLMVRESHNVNISNKERAQWANRNKCSAYIRLHADAASSSGISGASVLTSSAKNPHTRKVQKSSEKLSRDILSEYIKATNLKNRGVSYRDDLTGTNWATEVTTTLLEMGFMTNPEEDRKMASPDFQKKMVAGIVNGIDKYFREK